MHPSPHPTPRLPHPAGAPTLPPLLACLPLHPPRHPAHPTPTPSPSPELFDKLALLSEGALLYFGASEKAEHFFAAAGHPVPAHRSPADHFLHAINKDFAESEDIDANIQHLLKAYRASK